MKLSDLPPHVQNLAKAQDARSTVKAPMKLPGRHGRGKRKVPGEMNQTERKYYDRLDAEYRAGKILWFAYEPIRLKLANLTTYSPDFMVMGLDEVISMIEVKGGKKSKKTGKRSAFVEDDAAVKIKVASEIFPFWFAMVWEDASVAGGWGRKNFYDV